MLTLRNTQHATRNTQHATRNTQHATRNTHRHGFLCKLALFFCFLNVFNVSVQSQSTYQRDFTAKTPEANSFNKYGDIGVSYFTGSPNISFSLSLSEEVPISINYNASGIKPEEHHGWVGTNWNLNAGGMISRIKRGAVDEYIYPLADTINYFSNYSRLQGNISSWDNNALTSKMADGSVTDTAIRHTALADLEPDEFVFNFNGYSGSFMLNHEGKWIFRGNNPSEFELKDIQLRHEVYLDFMPFYPVTVPQTIVSFTIRTNDGTEYYFGNNDLTAVDYAYSSTKALALSRDQVPIPRGSEVISIGWHLTKIKYTSGKNINFTYMKDAFTVAENITKNLGRTKTHRPGDPTSGGSALQYPYTANCYNTTPMFNYTILWNSYLQEIQTPYEIIKFTKEELSGYADYSSSLNNNGRVSLTNRKWFKLSKIQTFKNPTTTSSKPLIEYKLGYIASASGRLQLNTISQVDVENTANPPDSIKQYAFEYNGGTLPTYLSGQIDHWGYMNDKGMLYLDLGTTDTLSTESIYKTYRAPNSVLMGYEMLKKVNYPTGGYISFEFEPHTYSAVADTVKPKNAQGNTAFNTAFGIKLEGTNKIAGGLRIKRIVNSNGIDSIEKSFLYVNNYNNQNAPTLSSGILASEPNYFDVFSGVLGSSNNINVLYHSVLNEQSLNPLNLTSGSPVTYSEVVEKSRDNAYTIYKFSNFDNPDYCNRTPKEIRSKYNTKAINPVRDPVIDYEHLRGRIMTQKLCDNSDKVVKEIKNEYTSFLDSSQAIRAVTFALSRFCASGDFDNERRAISYYIHTSPAFLKKSTITDYYYNGTTTSQMAVITENAYDAHKNIIEQKVTNLNNTETQSNVTTKYYYAYDSTNILIPNTYVSETVTGTKQLMINKFMIGIPLETKNNFNKGSKIEFKKFNNGVIDSAMLPFIFYSQNQSGTDFIEQFRIKAYSNYDKPDSTLQKGFSIPVVYSWTNGLLTKKSMEVTTPSATKLEWTFTYDQTKRLLTEKTNENGLKTKFTVYDGYRRLKTVIDRMKEDDTNPQAKMEYDYHLKNGTTDNNYVQTTITYGDGYPRAVGATLPPILNKQFIDGLGRPFMSYRKDYTQDATLKHQKTYMTYDALGRPDKSYHPFGSVSEDVHASDATTLALTSSKFVRTVYEASPLSRPLKQIMEDTQKITMRYNTNTGTEAVRKFTVTSSSAFNTPATVTPNSTYAANTLSKTTVWNENGSKLLVPTVSAIDSYAIRVGRTDVFKDKLGRVILTRKFVQNQFEIWFDVDTYNVYDSYGNLVMVIPPSAIANDTVTLQLTFQYIYDNQNRLRGKKVPNAAWQYFYYDNRDLLVLTQDGNMRASSSGTKYLGTEYDPLGRVLKTGFVSVSGDPSVYLQNNIVTIPEATYLTKNIYYQNKNWVNFTYNRVLTASDVTPPKATLYTEYDQVRPGLYNYKGFPYWVIQENLFGIDEMTNDYNGAGKPTISIRYSFVGYEGNYGNFARTWEEHNYDKALRPLFNTHQFYNAITSTDLPKIDMLNQFTYDVKDRLKQKDIGFKSTNSKYLQNTDYTYNDRGWLLNINNDPFFLVGSPYDYPIFNCTDNSVMNSTSNTSYGSNAFTFPTAQSYPAKNNPDLFSEWINYDYPENGMPNGKNPDGTNRTQTPPQHNGNISQIRWQVAGREMQTYAFNYDNLDRLTEANYGDWHTGSYTVKGWETALANDNKYQEKMSYDFRGNIAKLERNGLMGTTMSQAPNGLLYGCFGQIDNLTYNYDPNNANKLLSVTDAVTGVERKKGFAQNVAGTAYAYDDNGNLIADLNKKISNIEYNYLNLPVRITFTKEVTSGGMTTTFTTGMIEFMYTASGVKLQKKVIQYDLGGAPFSSSITNYSNGAEYDDNNSLVRLQHTEGAIVNNSGTFGYEYVLRDHLGNTRVTFGDADDNGVVVNSDIKQINSYYPFGLNMEGPGFGTQGVNKWQYNGKELNTDFGLNWNDYGARFYDPAVARWWSVDPLVEKYANWSPYNYVKNNPIKFIDPNGMGTLNTIFADAETGAILKESKDNLPDAVVFVAHDKVGEFNKRKGDKDIQGLRSAFGLMTYMVDGMNGIFGKSENAMETNEFVYDKDGKQIPFHSEFSNRFSIKWTLPNNYTLESDITTVQNGHSPTSSPLYGADDVTIHVHPYNTFSSFLQVHPDGGISMPIGGYGESKKFIKVLQGEENTPSGVDINNHNYRYIEHPKGYASFMFDVIVNKNNFVFYTHWRDPIKIDRSFFKHK